MFISFLSFCSFFNGHKTRENLISSFIHGQDVCFLIVLYYIYSSTLDNRQSSYVRSSFLYDSYQTSFLLSLYSTYTQYTQLGTSRIIERFSMTTKKKKQHRKERKSKLSDIKSVNDYVQQSQEKEHKSFEEFCHATLLGKKR